MPEQGKQGQQSQQKKFKVTRSFTDASGRQWQEGEEYSGQDAERHMREGNLQQAPQQ